MTGPDTAASGPRPSSSLPWPWVEGIAPPVVFVLLFATFSVVASHFCTLRNVLTLLTRTSIIALLGIGSLVVLMTGAVDLSLGAVMAVSGIATVVSIAWGAPIWLSMVLGVAMGGLVGLVNGWLVARLRLPSFLSTLAVASLIYGVLGVLFLGQRSEPAPPPTMPAGLGALAASVLRITTRDASGTIVEVFPGISWIVVVTVAVAAASTLILKRTRYGRVLVLIGTAPEAARFSGLRVDRVRTVAFACAGLLAGLAAVLLTSFLMMPPVGLSGYEFIAIECAIIGGASLSGGRGSVAGAVVGALIVTTLDMGLTMTNADHLFLPMILNGVILVATVCLDRSRRRMERTPA